MKYILLFLAAISCIITAEARVDLKMGYYNSYDDMSMSLDGFNLNFGSACALMPDSITYDNGGASNQPRSEYSYAIVLNEEAAFSSAKTDSGMFAFKGTVRAGIDDEDLLNVSAKSGVKDGHLCIAYGTDEFIVQETVEAVNSVYQQEAFIGNDNVTSSGFGSTLGPVPGLAENLMARANGSAFVPTIQPEGEDAATGEDNSGSFSEEAQDQGIRYSLNIQNAKTGKDGYVEANVMGLTEAQLATRVEYKDDGYLFGAKTRGIGFAPVSELSMTGQATGLPVQTLPPGVVEVSYRDLPPSTDEPTNITPTIDWEDYLSYLNLVDRESEKFDTDYPGNSTPALWYHLNNEFINEVPIYVYYTFNDSLKPLEAYQLEMTYEVEA